MSRAPWMLVTATVDPAVRDEFESWYREVHHPHVIAIPGIVQARRLNGPMAFPSYAGLYTFEDDAAVQRALSSPEVQVARGDWERWSDHIRDLTVRFLAEATPTRVAFRDN